MNPKNMSNELSPDEKQDEFDLDRAKNGEIMVAIHGDKENCVLFRCVYLSINDGKEKDGFFVQTWGLINRPAFIKFDEAKERLRMTGIQDNEV